MDRFRIDDPDAAEKAARLFVDIVHPGWVPNVEEEQAMKHVLDAIEQPRLPTRSTVELALQKGWCELSPNRSVKSQMRELEPLGVWATEDPEPEVDPAQVEALAQAMAESTKGVDAAGFMFMARKLLASGRVQVTPQ